MQPELRRILADILDVQSVSEQDSAESIASWDSVRHLTLITAIEERFGITFDANEVLDLTSVAAIAGALQRRGCG